MSVSLTSVCVFVPDYQISRLSLVLDATIFFLARHQNSRHKDEEEWMDRCDIIR